MLLQNIKHALHPSIFKKYLIHFALQGNNVVCVCCGAKYITFLPAGIQKRANAKCINCGSFERHRTLWHFLQKHGDIFNKPLKMLHVAPEKIYYHKFISLKNIEYHPIDLMPDRYAYGNKTLQMDVTDLTYTDNFFDVVICNHVLEHIPLDTKAMSEIFRVLKPNG